MPLLLARSGEWSVAVSPSETQEQHALRAPERLGRVSGLGSLCGLQLWPVTFQPPPHSACPHPTVVGCVSGLGLRANLLSEGFCLFQPIPCAWRQAGLASPARVGEGGSRRGTSKRGVDAKEGTSQGLCSFPPWYNHPFEQKIGIYILTNRNALRIFKIRTGKFCCICQNPRQSR